MPENGHPVHIENEIGRNGLDKAAPGDDAAGRYQCCVQGHAHELVVGKRSCIASTIRGRSGGVLPVGLWKCTD